MSLYGARAMVRLRDGQKEHRHDGAGQALHPRRSCGAHRAQVHRAAQPILRWRIHTIEHDLVVATPCANFILHLHHVRQMLVGPPAAAIVTPTLWIAPTSTTAWHAAGRTPGRVAFLSLTASVSVVGTIDGNGCPIDHDTANSVRIQVGVLSVDQRRWKPAGAARGEHGISRPANRWVPGSNGISTQANGISCTEARDDRPLPAGQRHA